MQPRSRSFAPSWPPRLIDRRRCAFALIAVAIALCQSQRAISETRKITWHGAVIEYDAAHFRLTPPTDGSGLVLTCIASDCPGQPHLYAIARNRTDDVEDGKVCPIPEDLHGNDWARLDLSREGAGATMGFSAFSAWTGCRAMDAPVLDACAERDGVVYRLTNWLAGGCNYNPEMPVHRFIELLNAVRSAR